MTILINYDISRWWRPLLIYTCFSILLIYTYQLPVSFPNMFLTFADFVGLYKITGRSDFPELCSGASLLLFYYMVSIGLFFLNFFPLFIRKKSLTEFKFDNQLQLAPRVPRLLSKISFKFKQGFHMIASLY